MFQQDLSSIVVDVGSLTTKAGFSGEDTPKYLLPSFVGTVSQGMQEEGTPSQYLVGDNSLNVRMERMDIKQVFSQGRVKDFEAYEQLLSGVLNHQMRADPSNYSLLLSEDNIHNRTDRETIAKIVFETLKVKNLFFCKTAVLSCFATGRSTALIMDSGADMSSAVTVHDGFVLSKLVKRTPIGGEALTKEVETYIEQQLNTVVAPRIALINPNGLNPSFCQFHKNSLLRDIKESLFRTDQTLPMNDSQVTEYQLPDKTILRLQRSRLPDLFFSPTTNDSSFKGLQHLITDNISQCDVDIRKELYSNMVLTGGNTLLGGFTSKIQSKVSELSPSNVKLKLISFPFPSERRFAPWIGGSIVSSLSSFQSFWVGAQEWQEHGASILDKKCA